MCHASSYIFGPLKISEVLCSIMAELHHCYHHHCLENMGWPSTITVWSCELGVDSLALQEQEGHKWQASQSLHAPRVSWQFNQSLRDINFSP